MKCRHCGDPAWRTKASAVHRVKGAEHAKHLIVCGDHYYLAGGDGELCCMECWREITLGHIPPLGGSRIGGNVGNNMIREDVSPSDENAARALEDWA